ncbi:MAG: MarR family winged helix-turn-helix transcriptional regulator [Humidesulfovibrio sp.]|nr:MarR family winged helix-turn-helix transcriptional regulator [Humidesulfovibrio sp.]
MNDQERNLLRQIGRTGRAMYAAFEAEVGHALPRWRILQELRSCGSATQKQIALQLQMDPGALTRQMKTLEAEGLVARLCAPEDNRLTVAALTPAGLELIEATQPRRENFMRKALEGLPPGQVDAALAVLSILEERFRLMHRI